MKANAATKKREKEERAALKALQPPKIVKTAEVVKSKNFDFIVGSFATDESANVLIDKLKSTGFKAYLITDDSGKHRVSAGSASTDEEIKTIADKSKASGVDGWVLKK